jgi:hypothetical protein
MTTQVYATQVTAYFLAAQAAYQASPETVTPLNIAGGTLVVGDGNGSVPSISALIAANGVTHQVWSGQTINSVSVDPNNPDQLDIACEIPAAIGGAEIGPFAVTEFAILDQLGNCCVVGTTNLQKTTSGEGQTSDLLWIAAVVYSVAGSVTVTPPSGGYATMGQVISWYDANLPGVIAPITKTDTTNSGGTINRLIGIAPATQPSDPVSPASSGAAMGSGRPASAAEYAAFAPTSGGFAWPWPTLQQVGASFAALWSAINAFTADLSAYLLKSGGTMTGSLVLAGDPTANPQAATKHYVDEQIAAIGAFVPIAGGTMTGFLTLNADPVTAMEAVTKEYVDNANPFTTTGVGAVMICWGIASPSPSNFLGTTGALQFDSHDGLIEGTTAMPSGGSTNYQYVWSGGYVGAGQFLILFAVDVRWPSSSPPGTWKIMSIGGNTVTLMRVA